MNSSSSIGSRESFGVCTINNADAATKWQNLGIAIVIIVGIGGLVVAGVGGAGLAGSISQLSQFQAIIMIAAGGGGGVAFLIVGAIISIVSYKKNNDQLNPTGNEYDRYNTTSSNSSSTISSSDEDESLDIENDIEDDKRRSTSNGINAEDSGQEQSEVSSENKLLDVQNSSQDSNDNTDSFLLLPEEIILRIFSFLSWYDVTYNLPLVNKQWKRLARDEVFLKIFKKQLATQDRYKAKDFFDYALQGYRLN